MVEGVVVVVVEVESIPVSEAVSSEVRHCGKARLTMKM